MNQEKHSNNPIKIFGVMLPSLPAITIRLGGTLLRLKRDSNKAGKIFKKELIKQGIDKDTANELRQIYTNNMNFHNLIKVLKE